MNFKIDKFPVLQGYVKNKSLGPYSLPVKYQNQILKNYCEENNKIYSLPQAEPVFSVNFIQLKSLILDLEPEQGVVMISIFMLPASRNIRETIYKIILKKKTQVHFVFENIVISKKETFLEVENNFKYLEFTKNSQKMFNFIR